MLADLVFLITIPRINTESMERFDQGDEECGNYARTRSLKSQLGDARVKQRQPKRNDLIKEQRLKGRAKSEGRKFEKNFRSPQMDTGTDFHLLEKDSGKLRTRCSI